MSISVLNDERVSQLIDEIENRPPLYNKKLKDYLNNELKKKLWLDVYRAILSDWDNKTGEEKLEAGKEIQDKWNSLRSCFSRELREQKSTKAGPKRRKYIFFERLSFLLPHTRPRCSIVSHQSTGREKCKVSTEDPAKPSLESHSENHTSDIPRTKKDKMIENISAENLLMEFLKSNSTISEDVTFALSLVPFLQRISQDMKLDARIKILQVLRQFITMQHHSMVSNIQTVPDQSQGICQMATGSGVNEALVPEMETISSDELSLQTDDIDIKEECSDK